MRPTKTAQVFVWDKDPDHLVREEVLVREHEETLSGYGSQHTSVTHLEQAISLETYKDISRLIGPSAIFFFAFWKDIYFCIG